MQLPPLRDEDWPERLAHLKDGFVGKGNVYRVMAHHPALLAAWTAYRDHVVLDTALGAELSEVAILRIGHRLDAPYEWAHHVVRGRRKGLDDTRIRSLAGPVEAMAEDDALIAGAVDALLDEARLPPGLADALSEHLGAAGVLDLIATVGFYSTLAYILRSFDTPIDGDILAELERRPLSGH